MDFLLLHLTRCFQYFLTAGCYDRVSDDGCYCEAGRAW